MGEPLTVTTAFKRAVTDTIRGSGHATETTPLLSNHVISPEQKSFLRRLLWENDTPGLDSDSFVTRWSAHAFHVFKLTLLCSPVNVLLVFIPIGIVAGEANWGAAAVFSLNFLAIIPLAAILSFATEEIAEHLGPALGGLLNATFGNAVELIVSIVALSNGQIEVVQSSMLGSILSNVLLVMGMCFLLGGIYNMRDGNGDGREQEFAKGTAQTSCSLLALASATLIIPATLYAVMDRAGEDEKNQSILVLSRGTAILMLILYVSYLWFQLRTHKNLFDPELASPSKVQENLFSRSQSVAAAEGLASRESALNNNTNSISPATAVPPINAPNSLPRANDTVDAHEEGENGGGSSNNNSVDPADGHISPITAGVVLVITTIIIAFCADYLVGSIDDIVATGAMSKNFIGLILIPIVGNAAEHVTACVVAVRDKMDLAMSVAIGSSIQIALLVTPFLVILGWAFLDQPMTLHFETFETVVFALSVLVVSFTVQDGSSNYLEGAMLLGLYAIIALAFYAAPSDALGKADIGAFLAWGS